MAIDPVTAALDIGGKLIDRLWPDPAQAASAKLELVKLAQDGDLAEIAGQMKINEIEAASQDRLQHWRGALGWICVFAFGYSMILRPMLMDVFAAFGKPITLTTLDSSVLTSLTFGMLGLSTQRTFEKIKGVLAK